MKQLHRRTLIAISAAALTLGLGATFSVFAAGQSDLINLVMPDAQVIGGLDVAAAKASPFGQHLLLQIPNNGFAELEQVTGFDPRTDVTEVVSAARSQGSALLVGRGNFEPGRIAELVTQNRGRTRNYRGVTILMAPTRPATTGGTAPIEIEPAAAFPNASLVLVGSEADVEAAIDRYLSGATNTSPLAAKAIDASKTGQAWGVSTGFTQILSAFAPGENLQSAPPEAAMILNMLSAVNGTSGSVQFGASAIAIRGTADMRSPEDAQAAANVIAFFKTAQQNELPPLAKSVSITASGSQLNFSLEVPELDAEAIFTTPHTVESAQAPRAIRESRRQER